MKVEKLQNSASNANHRRKLFVQASSFCSFSLVNENGKNQQRGSNQRFFFSFCALGFDEELPNQKNTKCVTSTTQQDSHDNLDRLTLPVNFAAII